MADETHELLLDTPIEDEDEQPESDAPEAEPDEQQPDDDLHIELDGIPDEEETPVARDLRKRLRDTERELHSYRAQSQPKPIEVGAEPEWNDGDGWEFDGKAFSAAHAAWTKRRDEAAEQKRTAEQTQAERNRAWERSYDAYRSRAGKLGAADFDTAEERVKSTLPTEMQSAIIMYADAPEKLIYALGKNPAALDRLASETDPARVIYKLGQMEKGMKVGKRIVPAPARNVLRGSAPVSAQGDKRLAKLEAEAERTGDRSALAKYRFEQRSAK